MRGYWGLFVLLFVVVAHCNVVSYVYNSKCSTEGCDFNDNSIWNATINPGDSVYITNNETITLFMNNLNVNLSYMEYGWVAPVNLIVSNSSLYVFIPGVLSFLKQELSWGASSSLSLFNNSLLMCGFVNGTSLTVSQSNVIVDIIEAGDVTLDSNSSLSFGMIAMFKDLEIINSVIIGESVIVSSIISTGSIFNLTESLTISGNASFNTSTVFPDRLVFSNNGSIVNFYDTQVVGSLSLSYDSYVAFYSNDPNIDLIIYQIELSSGEIHLGDNVNAFFGNGNIPNLTLGNNVNILFGEDGADAVIVENILQVTSGSFANITIQGQLTLFNTVPIYANIWITNVYLLPVFSIYQLYLSPKSSISGYGNLMVYGTGYFSGSTVSVSSVYWQQGGLIIADLVTADYMTSIYMVGKFDINVIGNVLINNPYRGLNLGSAYANVTGDYTQIGGYLNVTIRDSTNSSSPFLLVSGKVTLQDVTINAEIFMSVDSKTNAQFLIVESGNSIVAPGLSLGDFIFSSIATASMIQPKTNELYLTLKGKGQNGDGNNGIWNSYWIPIVCVGSAIGAIMIIFIIATLIRRRRRHHYNRVNH